MDQSTMEFTMNEFEYYSALYADEIAYGYDHNAHVQDYEEYVDQTWANVWAID
jgi:hypothetical protein